MGPRNYEPDEADGSGLAGVIDRLTDEINTLRVALDDLREELVWELRQLREGTPEWQARFKLTSMPLDPAAPDFHQRVNAVDAGVMMLPAENLSELVERLTRAAATSQLAANDWAEDQEFPPGETVEIEASILDWFNEYLVVVKRENEWFLADDGEGSFFLLWTRAERSFLRMLTDPEQEEVTRLSGLKPDEDYREQFATTDEPPAEAPQATPSTQRCLW
jgi:hypothetical protein